jgi:hypothetical protein
VEHDCAGQTTETTHYNDIIGAAARQIPKAWEPVTRIPKITQETLAEMIGTTRSRVSFFMNRFRDLSFIEYNGGIKVHKSLLNVIFARLNGPQTSLQLAFLGGICEQY